MEGRGWRVEGGEAPEDAVVVGVVLDEHLGAEGDAIRLQVLEQPHLLHDREDLLHVDRACRREGGRGGGFEHRRLGAQRPSLSGGSSGLES